MSTEEKENKCESRTSVETTGTAVCDIEKSTSLIGAPSEAPEGEQNPIGRPSGLHFKRIVKKNL